MSALSRRCCHVQPEAEKNTKGSRGKKSDKLQLKRQKIRVSQAGGRRRMSVIRECCRAPQLKLVHCSVELVRNYCSLYPALNLSYCSGSAPSCVRLFEVGKSCSHVLLMLSVCLSRAPSFSPVLTASPQKWRRDLEQRVLFVLHPLFTLNRAALCRLRFWFGGELKPVSEVGNIWCNSLCRDLLQLCRISVEMVDVHILLLSA